MYDTQQSHKQCDSSPARSNVSLGASVTFEDDELVSVKWIAERTRLSRMTIRRHLDHAGIKPLRFGLARNSTIRYRKSEVERWLRACWPV